MPASPRAPKLPNRLRPSRLWVLAVGILEYDDGVHWALETRRDTVLLDALRRRGTPDEQIIFLADAKATLRRVRAALLKLLRASQPGDQLLVYYAGHGGRDPDHGGLRLRLRDERLPASEIFAWIERHFEGDAAILTADCCYSGGLALEAPLRAGRVAYAALGSSLSTLPSTGRWTFTNCWIDAIEGRIPVDLDADRVIRIDELARYAEQRLAFVDGQVCSFGVANGFPSTFALGRAKPRPHRRHGELVLARTGSKEPWTKAEILGQPSSRKLAVRLVIDGEELVVAKSNVKAWAPPSLPHGKGVSVRYDDKWYRAVVLAARNGMHLVRYKDYHAGWDEWVSADRIKQLTRRGKRLA